MAVAIPWIMAAATAVSAKTAIDTRKDAKAAQAEQEEQMQVAAGERQEAEGREQERARMATIGLNARKRARFSRGGGVLLNSGSPVGQAGAAGGGGQELQTSLGGGAG